MKKQLTFCILLAGFTGLATAQTNQPVASKFDVTVRDVAPINMVYYPFTGPYERSFDQFGNLMAYLQQNKIALGGQSLGIYYDDPATVSADKLRCDVGMMVAKKADVSGNYKFKALPAGKAVSVRYHSMDEIMPAYQAISQYIAEKGLKTEPYSIEIYYSADPTVVDAEILMMIKQ